MQLGANFNCIDSIGRTSLHYLCAADSTGDLLTYLIKRNTSDNRFLCINAQTDSGVTPLMLACQRGNANAIVELLKNGASPFLRDQNGWTVHEYYTVKPCDRNAHQQQVPKLIEKAKYQWLQQVSPETIESK